MNNHSKQLCGYVKARREMELQGQKRPVAGFVVVVYDSEAQLRQCAAHFLDAAEEGIAFVYDFSDTMFR
eukprot:scaffold50627_cov40-Attheya_sp.AAC.1